MIKVKLLEYTPNPEHVVAMAARLCYSSVGAEELAEKISDEKAREMVRKILRGIEGVQFADVTVQAEKGSYDFLVEARPNVDVRKPMFMALAKAGYPILQLKSMDLSLEDIFLSLVEEKKRQRNPQNKAPRKISADKAPKKVSAETALNVSGGETLPGEAREENNKEVDD